VQFAGDDSRVDLVESAHPFRDGPRADERQPLHGAPEHLEIDVVHRLCEGDALGGLSMGAVGIAVLEQRQRGFAKLEPRALRARRLFLEKSPGALQPAAGDSVLAAEGPVVPGQPHGDARRPAWVAAVEEQAICPLTRVEYRVGVIEPPCGEAEALERLGRLAVTKAGLERLGRLLPGATVKRLLTVRATVGHRHDFETMIHG
jgi:hypothetical protein